MTGADPLPRLEPDEPEATELVIELPSDLRLIEAVVGYLVGRCRTYSFGGPSLELNFRVGVTEALANAILYGNRSDPGKTIRVEMSLDVFRVVISVADEGDGFDPSAVPDPTAPENINDPGGRGLFLIRHLMDETEFNERGNVIRMVLNRDPPPGVSPSPLKSHPIPTALDADPALKGVGPLIEKYARAHRVEVWIWQLIGDTWVLAAGTSEPPKSIPGQSAVPLETPSNTRLCIELGGADREAAAARTGFVALMLDGYLRAQAESRFFGREIAERYEEITLLYTISEILGSVISLAEAAQTILREVTDTMGVVRAALWIYEPETKNLELVAAVGGDVLPGPIRVDDAVSITAAVFRDRRPMILQPEDVYPRNDRFAIPSNRDSFLAVPVSYTPPQGEPRTIGVINLVGRRVEEGFSAGDHKLITAIASQIGAAVENSRLVMVNRVRDFADRLDRARHLIQREGEAALHRNQHLLRRAASDIRGSATALHRRRDGLQRLGEDIATASRRVMADQSRMLATLDDWFSAVGFEQTLRRGFSIVTSRDGKTVIKSAKQVSVGDRLDIRFADGTVQVEATER